MEAHIMSTDNAQPRLVFVGGPPRSGTTLLQNMLDSHPEIVGGPEFLHLPDIVSLRKKLHGSVARKWIDLFCSHEDVDTHIRQLIESFLLPFARSHEAAILSEKTPENILVFSELGELLPEASFIQVTRDPRAVVASLMQVAARARKKGLQPAPFTRSLDAAIEYVRKCLRAGEKAVQRNPDKVLTVTYESLVQSPRSESEKVCAFLNIDWSPDMLTPAAHKHLGEQAITVNSNELWHDARTYNSNPNTDSLEKWQSTLTPMQQYLVTKAFQDDQVLCRLDYRISVADLPTPPSPAARLGSAVMQAGQKIKSSIRRAAKSL